MYYISHKYGRHGKAILFFALGDVLRAHLVIFLRASPDQTFLTLSFPSSFADIEHIL